MKSVISHIAVVLAVLLILGSCKSDSSTYPSVQLEFLTAQTGSDGKLVKITTDKNNTYAVSNDQTSSTYAANKTLRIVANYTLEAIDKDTTANVYASIAAVYSTPLASNKFKQGIKTDPAEVLSAWQGRNYLNIVLNILAQKKAHTFGFVEQSVTTGTDGRFHVSILLYHDSDGDLQAYTKRAYLSIPLVQYAGTDNKGALITFSLYTNDGSLKSYEYEYKPQILR